ISGGADADVELTIGTKRNAVVGMSPVLKRDKTFDDRRYGVQLPIAVIIRDDADPSAVGDIHLAFVPSQAYRVVEDSFGVVVKGSLCFGITVAVFIGKGIQLSTHSQDVKALIGTKYQYRRSGNFLSTRIDFHRKTFRDGHNRLKIVSGGLHQS